MNAEAAAEALKLARQRHEDGDDVSALRLVEKALKMDATLEDARTLLDFLKKQHESAIIVQVKLNRRFPRNRIP